MHSYGNHGGASLGAEGPSDQRPNGSASLSGNFTPADNFRAYLSIDSPSTGVELVGAAFSSPMALHLSANSGLTILGHLTGLDSVFPAGLEYESYGRFAATLSNPLGNSASYIRTFGSQGGNDAIDEWFSLTLYNRSNEAVDLDWQMQGTMWVSLGAVPEPGGLAMSLAGFAVLGGLIARKRYRSEPLA